MEHSQVVLTFWQWACHPWSETKTQFKLQSYFSMETVWHWAKIWLMESFWQGRLYAGSQDEGLGPGVWWRLMLLFRHNLPDEDSFRDIIPSFFSENTSLQSMFRRIQYSDCESLCKSIWWKCDLATAGLSENLIAAGLLSENVSGVFFDVKRRRFARFWQRPQEICDLWDKNHSEKRFFERESCCFYRAVFSFQRRTLWLGNICNAKTLELDCEVMPDTKSVMSFHQHSASSICTAYVVAASPPLHQHW